MNTALLLICAVVLLAYSWQLGLIRNTWKGLPDWEIPEDFQPAKKISVLVPFRNEEENLVSCLDALLGQNLPDSFYDIHLINDHSIDRSMEILENYEAPNLFIHQVAVGEAGKKAALNYGVRVSENPLIVTTDADCISDPDWLLSILSYYESENPVMVCGAVSLEPIDTPFTRFQALDFVGMMGITAVGIASGQIRLCNGANLAFDRQAFEKINGYQGVDHIASGDDVLLLDKMEKEFPGRVAFLKKVSGIVKTKPIPGWSEFLAQRIRWAGKTSKNPHWPSLIVSALVFLTCVAVISSFILIPYWGIFPFLVFFLWKLLSDFLFLETMASYYQRKSLLSGFFLSQVFHLFYWVLVGAASIIWQRVSWKGRRTNIR